MRKIINDANNFVDECIDGILLAHPNQLRAADSDRRAIVRADAGSGGKVGIVTGGGSGHLPLFLGYVGTGLASGVAVGNVFSSPSPAQIYAATRASDDGAGVLYLYGNYGGDIYNFDLAADLAGADGIETKTVLGADDVASASKDKAATRRGVAGLFFAYKTAGAAADRGDDLETVARIAQKTCDRVATMGVGLSPTILPAAGEPTFELADGEMELGIGIHGEPGVHRGPLESADAITERLTGDVLNDLQLPAGASVAVLVNGLGATPLEELYVMYRKVHQMLAENDVDVARVYIGEYATSLEMAGASVSILHLDDELTDLLDAPAASPFYQHAAGGVSADVTSAKTAAQADNVKSGEREIATLSEAGPLLGITKQVLEALPQYGEELRKLDAALGDGDLGITVAEGAKAARNALGDLPENAAPSEVLRSVGSAFAAANPSTFAALVGGGIVAAASKLPDTAKLSAEHFADALAEMTERIQQRGKAQLGDKTMVDVLAAFVKTLQQTPAQTKPKVIADNLSDAAAEVVTTQREQRSARGRAAWVGERSIGHADPGQVAFWRLASAIADALSDDD